MDQPGVEVRPIKMISGDSEFNEVFFTDATCPRDDVVGGVNNGWAVAMTLLGYERGAAAATMPIRFQDELDRLLDAGQGTRRRRRAGHAPAPGPVLHRVCRSCGGSACARSPASSPATAPGPESSIFKLVLERVPPRAPPSWRIDILGPDAIGARVGARRRRRSRPTTPGAPNSSASWTTTFLTARAETIYAGTSQIQRNILGERVLGLPKEPEAPSAGGRGSTKDPA